MKLTVIRDDGVVYKDNLAYNNLDMSSVPANVHCLQWKETSGWIEFSTAAEGYKQANEPITALPAWALDLITLWEKTAARLAPPKTALTLQAAKLQAVSKIATRRYELETSGITLNGSRIKTDRVSQAAITATYINMTNGLLTSINWKIGDGVFVQLDLIAITAIASAVTGHVQRCFTAEKVLSEQVFAATTIEEVAILADAPLGI
jgi:hypothetical protein